MKIVIIGTGNVATVLAKKLKAAHHSILQVYGRNESDAIVLAGELAAAYCASWNDIVQGADLYIAAITDTALPELANNLQLDKQLVVHTAGAVSINLLKNVSSSYGVLYPFQSVRKETAADTVIPFMIDANTDAARQKLLAIAETISASVTIAGDEARLQYHLCAVVTNNFSNYLYVLAEDYCTKQGLNFKNLLPLLDETSRRLHQFSPRQVQTGPAVRSDRSTMQRHLSLLRNEPALAKFYQIFSEEIMDYNW